MKLAPLCVGTPGSSTTTKGITQGEAALLTVKENLIHWTGGYDHRLRNNAFTRGIERLHAAWAELRHTGFTARRVTF